jgi:hypothetical protein
MIAGGYNYLLFCRILPREHVAEIVRIVHWLRLAKLSPSLRCPFTLIRVPAS